MQAKEGATLIFDFDNIAHRVYHSMTDGKTNFNIAKRGNIVFLTQAIATFIAARIRFLAGIIEVEDVYVCADPMVSSWRKNLYEDYKGTRSGDEDLKTAIKEAASAFDQNLKLMFMPEKPYEADDLISITVNELSTSGKRSMIISTDDDFTQLMAWDLTSMFKFNKNLIYSYTDANYYLKTDASDILSVQINPVVNLLEKVFLGCKSDNIPKILPKKMKVGYFKAVLEIMMELEQDPLTLTISMAQELEIDLEEVLAQFEIVSLHHLPAKLKEEISAEFLAVNRKKENITRLFTWKRTTVNFLLEGTIYKPLI